MADSCRRIIIIIIHIDNDFTRTHLVAEVSLFAKSDFGWQVLISNRQPLMLIGLKRRTPIIAIVENDPLQQVTWVGLRKNMLLKKRQKS